MASNINTSYSNSAPILISSDKSLNLLQLKVNTLKQSLGIDFEEAISDLEKQYQNISAKVSLMISSYDPADDIKGVMELVDEIAAAYQITFPEEEEKIEPVPPEVTLLVEKNKIENTLQRIVGLISKFQEINKTIIELGFVNLIDKYFDKHSQILEKLQGYHIEIEEITKGDDITIKEIITLQSELDLIEENLKVFELNFSREINDQFSEKPTTVIDQFKRWQEKPYVIREKNAVRYNGIKDAKDQIDSHVAKLNIAGSLLEYFGEETANVIKLQNTTQRLLEEANSFKTSLNNELKCLDKNKVDFIERQLNYFSSKMKSLEANIEYLTGKKLTTPAQKDKYKELDDMMNPKNWGS